jgi:hypothetical protein
MNDSRKDAVLIRLPQAARELGVPVRQLYGGRDRREFEFYQFNSRWVYVRRGVARAWLERCRRQPGNEGPP